MQDVHTIEATGAGPAIDPRLGTPQAPRIPLWQRLLISAGGLVSMLGPSTDLVSVLEAAVVGTGLAGLGWWLMRQRALAWSRAMDAAGIPRPAPAALPRIRPGFARGLRILGTVVVVLLAADLLAG